MSQQSNQDGTIEPNRQIDIDSFLLFIKFTCLFIYFKSFFVLSGSLEKSSLSEHILALYTLDMRVPSHSKLNSCLD